MGGGVGGWELGDLFFLDDNLTLKKVLNLFLKNFIKETFKNVLLAGTDQNCRLPTLKLLKSHR